MENILFDTLLKRKESLLAELKHIDELLKIYKSNSSSVVSDDTRNKKKQVVRSYKKRHKVKQQIIDILKSLGDEIYVADLIKKLIELYPNKDKKAIGGKARSYIHLLKTQGILESKQIGNNRYVYKMVKK